MRVGNTAELKGPQAVVNFIIDMLANGLAINDLNVRGAWGIEDTVIIEFDVKALRERDNKNVVFPCLDVYRFGPSGKIRDWRVYAIEPTHIA